jgi:hypothetical protein
VAIFEAPQDADEQAFERALWAQLQALHDADEAPWDPSVSDDPDDPHFSFSFAGMAFFIVGLHPGSARLSRRFPWPALIFNPHAQFERLRETGKYARMQKVIRDKECALQGDINPVLEDHGVDSEARQYSGRAVEPDWSPPFQTNASEPSEPSEPREPPPSCPFHRGPAALTGERPDPGHALPDPRAQRRGLPRRARARRCASSTRRACRSATSTASPTASRAST